MPFGNTSAASTAKLYETIAPQSGQETLEISVDTVSSEGKFDLGIIAVEIGFLTTGEASQLHIARLCCSGNTATTEAGEVVALATPTPVRDEVSTSPDFCHVKTTDTFHCTSLCI